MICPSVCPVYPSFAHRWSYVFRWGTKEEWLRVGELVCAGLDSASPCCAWDKTVQTLLCSSSSPSSSSSSNTPGLLVALLLLFQRRRVYVVYMCVLVCDTNVGQAVMNSGLATTSQTVNSSFFCFFVLIFSLYVQSSRKHARLSSVETNLIPDQIFFVWLLPQSRSFFAFLLESCSLFALSQSVVHKRVTRRAFSPFADKSVVMR